MSPKNPEDKPLTWRETVILGIAETRGEVKVGNAKIDAMDQRINGRLKRLEKVVFGDEESKLVGLAEQQRGDAREIKDLNKKWALAITVIVFFAQNLANYISKKMNPGYEWPLTEIHGAVVESEKEK